MLDGSEDFAGERVCARNANGLVRDLHSAVASRHQETIEKGILQENSEMDGVHVLKRVSTATQS